MYTRARARAHTHTHTHTFHNAVVHRLSLFVNAEDGASGNVGVNVGRAVEGVKDRDILGTNVRKHLLVLSLATGHTARAHARTHARTHADIAANTSP